MQFIIVTGMSGAGKSTVLKFLEDIGYFCIDNLPPSLIPKFVEICLCAGTDIEKVALGIDIRGGKMLNDLLPALKGIHEIGRTLSLNETPTKAGFQSVILFLDASDDIIVKRYKETRRSHPLAKNERIEIGISRERQLLTNIKANADYIIDTTRLLTRQLKEKINDIFLKNIKFDNLIITILSFGYKYGIPNDSDLVFDVRFLPNPFYIQELREFTGNDKAVQDYVLGFEVSQKFLDRLVDMLEFLIPHYRSEGKNQLVISIGCTGGKHRSITLANEIFNYLQNKNYNVLLNHRDISRD